MRRQNHLAKEPLLLPCPSCTRPVQSCESSASPALVSDRANYQLTLNCQLDNLRRRVDADILADASEQWVDATIIALVCVFFNCIEGPESGVLFISTLHERPKFHTVINGRRVEVPHASSSAAR